MDEHTRHPQVGHETSDVNIWAIGKFGIALVVITVISIGLLIGVFRYFQSIQTEGAAVDPVKVFPNPRLQSHPVTDLREVRETEDKLLHGYGWVDPQKGIARIPIDQAIDMVAKKGLPSRQAAPQIQTVSVPTESGLGTK
jgi:hypothetical protein